MNHKVKKSDNNKKKILSIYLIFTGERVKGLNCLPLDYVWINWQMNILKKISKFESDLAYKAHPENILPPPEKFLIDNKLNYLRANKNYVNLSSMFL